MTDGTDILFMKHYLVTGGAGFIGSNLVRFLVSNPAVTVTIVDDLSYGYRENLVGVLSKQVNFCQDSILNANLEELMSSADTVFHLAGISSLPECQSSPERTVRVNIEGTARVLEAARRVGVRRVVFASTSAVYENSDEPFSEIATVSPDLLYSWSKHSAESLSLAYSRNYGLDVVIARFFNVYGPGQDHLRPNPPLTSYLVHALIAGETPIIFNTSQVRRDYIFVSDLIQLLFKLAEYPSPLGGEIFNLGSGVAYSPLEILEIVSEVLNVELKFQNAATNSYWDKYPSLSQGLSFNPIRVTREIYKRSISDSRKIQRLLNITPRVSMRQGLSIIADSIKAQVS